jgi:hypothetical protein
MYANHFKMIRLSYESASANSYAQNASDGKITDQDLVRALTNLENAGYDRKNLEAYILTGLPGQSMDENEKSALAVHNLDVKVRICQYTPIPGTRLFNLSCSEYGVNPDEPLLHNNSILPSLDQRISYQDFQRFKDHIIDLNRAL